MKIYNWEEFLWKPDHLANVSEKFTDNGLSETLINNKRPVLEKSYTSFVMWHNNLKLNSNLPMYFFLTPFINTSYLNNFFFILSANTEKIFNNNIEMPNTNKILFRNYIYYENDLDVSDNFYFLRKTSFISFFVNNLIDTPSCFKKIKSLKRTNMELPMLKFINFFMKKGKKEQYAKYFFKAISFFYSHETKKINFKIYNIKNNNIIHNISQANNYDLKFFKKNDYSWIDLFLSLNNVWNCYKHNAISHIKLDTEYKYDLNYGSTLTTNNKQTDSNYYLKNYLQLKLNSVLPIFNFFIHNVDKNVKKYSRGKSGKYTFVWKYVTIYKRIFVAIKLLLKDIKFAHGQKLSNRIQNSMSNLFLEPKKTFLWKSKTFAYNYIFKNYRSTLMTSLRTIR